MIRLHRLLPLVVCLILAGFETDVSGQSADKGVTYVSASGTTLRLLIDKGNLGNGDVELGEMNMPAGLDTAEHTHGVSEIFYVISGELQHVVNGRTYVLKPGMAGFVKPPDKVKHKVGSNGPVKAIVVWAPGGEAARIATEWRREP